MDTMRIHLFGDLSITYGETPVMCKSVRLQSLLAFLLLHCALPQSRQQVAFAFWPELSERQARNNLRQVLYDLRRVLPDADSFVDVGDATVQWRLGSPFTLDVLDFESALARAETAEARTQRAALEEAVELYRGDLLVACYDDWILPERERLRQRFMRALERLIALLEAERDYRLALEHAQRLLHCDPLREETYCDLMRLASRCGDRTGVVRYYRACVNALRKELEIEPSPETRVVYEQSLSNIAARSTQPTTPSSFLAVETNLPIQPNRFVGRAREVAEIKRWIAEHRLVTLTGPAGVGKTRLALAVTAEANFAHGKWFVGLGPVTDPAGIAQAVAFALGVREVRGRSLIETLSEYLRGKQLLILLDNCEHQTAGVRLLANALLNGAPSLHLLATSRETIGLDHEAVYRVPPLDVPGSVDEIAQSDSVQLFCERANAILPSFELTAENAPAIASICRALDGLPLAIELAAARMNVLSAEQIQERLAIALRLLTHGSHAALPHQRTLQGTLDWSYELLPAAERTLFRRLAVFAKSFSLEAIEQVCDLPPFTALDLLSNLVDQSLVEVIPGRRVVRYRLLEVMRQYGWARLCDSGEQEKIRGTHRDFYLQWAEQAEPEARGARQLEWFAQFERERDNLRAAVEWCQTDSPEKGLRLGAALWWFWFVGGYLSEGRAALAKMLSTSAPVKTTAYVRALNAAGFLALFQGDFAAARPYAERAYAIAQECKDKRALALALFVLGEAQVIDDRPRALANRKASLALSQELDDKWMMAFTLNALGEGARMLDDYETARAFYESSLQLRREIEDKRGIAVCFSNLGFVISHQGNIAEAHKFLQQALALRWEMKDKVGVAETLLGMAGLALKDASPVAARRAAVWLGALQAGLERIWTPLIGPDRKEFEEVAELARARLGAIEMERAWAEGQRISLDQAIAEALS